MKSQSTIVFLCCICNTYKKWKAIQQLIFISFSFHSRSYTEHNMCDQIYMFIYKYLRPISVKRVYRGVCLWWHSCELNRYMWNKMQYTYLTLVNVRLLTPYASTFLNVDLYASGPVPNDILISSIITGSTWWNSMEKWYVSNKIKWCVTIRLIFWVFRVEQKWIIYQVDHLWGFMW